MQEKSNLEKQPELSIISYIKNKDYEKDPISKKKVEEMESFVQSLDPEESGQPLPQQFSQHFIEFMLRQNGDELDKKRYSIIKEKLKDQIVVDLGVGYSYPVLLPFLKEIGVKEFIGIEKFLGENSSEYIDYIKEEIRKQKISGDYLMDDLLVFLSKLPDNSVSIIMNGIDSYVIDSGRYWDKLYKELCRVTHSKGIVTGYGSDISDQYSRMRETFNDIDPIDPEFRSRDIKILEKK